MNNKCKSCAIWHRKCLLGLEQRDDCPDFINDPDGKKKVELLMETINRISDAFDWHRRKFCPGTYYTVDFFQLYLDKVIHGDEA